MLQWKKTDNGTYLVYEDDDGFRYGVFDTRWQAEDYINTIHAERQADEEEYAAWERASNEDYIDFSELDDEEITDLIHVEDT